MRGVMVAYPAREGKVYEALRSPRETEDDEQRTIELFRCLGIDLADDDPDTIL